MKEHVYCTSVQAACMKQRVSLIWLTLTYTLSILTKMQIYRRIHHLLPHAALVARDGTAQSIILHYSFSNKPQAFRFTVVSPKPAKVVVKIFAHCKHDIT